MITYEFNIWVNGFDDAITVKCELHNAHIYIMKSLLNIGLSEKQESIVSFALTENPLKFLDDLIGFGIVNSYKLHVESEGCGL